MTAHDDVILLSKDLC